MWFLEISNFLKNFWRTRVFFMGPLMPLFWISGDVSSGFQSQHWQLYLHLAEVYVLHVPWDSPLVQHLPTSQWPAWQLSQSSPHTCKQALVGLGWETYCSTGKCSTDWAMLAGTRSETFLLLVLWVVTPTDMRIHWVLLTTSFLMQRNLLVIARWSLQPNSL